MTSISGIGSSASMIQQLMSTLQKADTDSSGSISFEEFSSALSVDGEGNAISASEGAASLEQMFQGICFRIQHFQRC